MAAAERPLFVVECLYFMGERFILFTAVNEFSAAKSSDLKRKSLQDGLGRDLLLKAGLSTVNSDY